MSRYETVAKAIGAFLSLALVMWSVYAFANAVREPDRQALRDLCSACEEYAVAAPPTSTTDIALFADVANAAAGTLFYSTEIDGAVEAVLAASVASPKELNVACTHLKQIVTSHIKLSYLVPPVL